MSGFELRISGVGSDHSTNCATATAQSNLKLKRASRDKKNLAAAFDILSLNKHLL